MWACVCGQLLNVQMSKVEVMVMLLLTTTAASTCHMMMPKLYTSADSEYFSPLMISGAVCVSRKNRNEQKERKEEGSVSISTNKQTNKRVCCCCCVAYVCVV